MLLAIEKLSTKYSYPRAFSVDHMNHILVQLKNKLQKYFGTRGFGICQRDISVFFFYLPYMPENLLLKQRLLSIPVPYK